jgi:hypothetical protein
MFEETETINHMTSYHKKLQERRKEKTSIATLTPHMFG